MTHHHHGHLDFPPNASHDITDDALADVLLSCPNIETATLSGIPDLSDRTVIRLANAADRLAEVDLSGCTEVTDISMLDFARLGTAVEVLKLNGVAGLTDRAICALARLPRVVELELCDLPLVTAFSVRDIWFYCRQLRRLRLSSCTHLTDKAFPNPPPSDGPTQETDSVGKRGKSSTEPSRPSSWLDALPHSTWRASTNFLSSVRSTSATVTR
ncbi:SCF E3 ubiquitin ligase complex F-box protein grrA [Grifola frondosa]|uniref:SCF E3 ubiquitin ligase complex F-box protein grrA n=1 Tax=Grifola frondosa TaxID=5627 RepID=A0A1C7M123_GRIFR|nr:SCF E3 ubiquitin ligase complex F-box protein grrA [Grifola frondosa]